MESFVELLGAVLSLLGDLFCCAIVHDGDGINLRTVLLGLFVLAVMGLIVAGILWIY